MRRVLAATASAAALVLTTATPAAVAAPNERACANGMHRTQKAHQTVPYTTAGNRNAHPKIPHFCDHH